MVQTSDCLALDGSMRLEEGQAREQSRVAGGASPCVSPDLCHSRASMDDADDARAGVRISAGCIGVCSDVPLGFLRIEDEPGFLSRGP